MWLQIDRLQQIDTLQHAKTHSSALQRIATHCNALQHTATRCNTLQHTTTGILQKGATSKANFSMLQCVASNWPIATRCSTLKCIATNYNTLQHTATHCNTLQHAATHCNRYITKWSDFESRLNAVTLKPFKLFVSALQFVFSVKTKKNFVLFFQCVAVCQLESIQTVCKRFAVCCTVLQCVAVWYNVL